MFTTGAIDQYSFIVSFGIGVMMATPLFGLCYLFILYRCFEEKIEVNLKLVAVVGLVSGILWNIGIYGCIFATIFLGLNCGYPLSQTYVIVSGIWRIFFKEIQGWKSIGLFCFSSVILIAGAALMGSYAIPT